MPQLILLGSQGPEPLLQAQGLTQGLSEALDVEQGGDPSQAIRFRILPRNIDPLHVGVFLNDGSHPSTWKS